MLQAICRTSAISMLLFLFSLHGAEAQIAPGVQQSAAQTATITGLVVQSNGAAVSDANVQLIGPAILTTKSDAHGVFAFTSVPYGVYQIVVTGAALGTTSRNEIVVAGDTNVTVQYEEQSSAGLKTIARVSTHSAGANINVTPASIASINPSDYAFQGNSSWKELLDRIPGVSTGGRLAGGGSSSDVIPDSPFQPIVLTINGAMPYETATMLDGMPLMNTSFSIVGGAGSGADLSYLPMSMFDTADIVRGPGASAPSIVDSIGGSFVLHAPGKVDANHVEFSASNDPYGGILSNIKAALRLGRFSATVTYSVNDSPGPLGHQNVITGESINPLTVGGQPFSCAPTSCDNVFADSSQYQSFYRVNTPLLYCCASVNTSWTQHNGAVALSYDVTPAVTAQVFYMGSSSVVESAPTVQPVDFIPGSGYAGGIAPGQSNYIFTQGPVPSSQASSLLEEKITAYTGRGVLRLAALQNNSFWKESANGTPDGQYTLYGTGVYTSAPSTPVVFNGTSEFLTFTPCHYLSENRVNNRDFLASYAVQVGQASSFGVSYVTSYYNNPYEIYEALPSFSFTFDLVVPAAVSEMTREVRLNAGTQFSEKLSLDASWYFAQGSYHVQNPSDPTGNTYTDSTFPYSAPRLGATWRVNRDMVIRASAGGGYALPPLSRLVGSNAVYLFGPYYFQIKQNLNLKPEQSFGFDIGTDMRLHRDTVLSFDFYRTNLYGQFFTSTSPDGTFNGLPLFTEESGNLAKSRYEGINIDLRHDVPKGIYWHGALGLTRGYVVNVPAGFYNSLSSTCDMSTGAGCTNTYIIPGANFNGQGTAGLLPALPYANGALQIGYRWSPGKYIDISPTYYGNGNSYFEPAFVEFDAHAGYAITKNISLLAIFRNITGIYGQNYQIYTPSLAAPTVAGLPYPLIGIPFGPRAAIITLNIKQ